MIAVPGVIAKGTRCPRCAQPVVCDSDGAQCPDGHPYARHDDHLDCSDPDAASGSTRMTFASLGYEWNTFDELRNGAVARDETGWFIVAHRL